MKTVAVASLYRTVRRDFRRERRQTSPL